MFEALEKNIQDVVAEQQLKLGYLEETLRLYYPLASLNGLMGSQCSAKEMKEQLNEFFQSVQGKYGEVGVTEEDGRFCLLLPPQAGEYVHQHIEEYGFLREFIKMMSEHGHSLEEVLSVFHRHSSGVQVEAVDNGEFDYIIYFKDGKPDDFIYCISVEGAHITYHRFTKEDYYSFDWA